MVYQEDITRFSEDFNNILLLIKEIIVKRELIKEKLVQLKSEYNHMVKSNNKKIFLFCLDSFFYQYKIYSVELEQIESSRKMVNNRMYCEYYKLYGIIVAYLDEIKLSYDDKLTLLNKCPVYKDLEPTTEYETNDVENIYNNIILLLNHLHDHMIKNSSEIEGYAEEGKIRFSISNFVNTLRNDNLILQGQIDLFTNYLSFFLNSQHKHYDRIYSRITDFFNGLDEGVRDDIIVPEENVVIEEDREHIPVQNVISEPIIHNEEKIETPRLDMSFE